MGWNKTHDLCVAVRKYADKDGKEKNQYQNIGMVMTNEKGEEMMLLNRTFNPAGVMNPDNKDSVVISKFVVKEGGSQNSDHQKQKQNGYQQSGDGLADDLPF